MFPDSDREVPISSQSVTHLSQRVTDLTPEMQFPPLKA